MLRKLRLCGGAILLVVSTSPCLRADAAVDDGWRRTKIGWEHLQTRRVQVAAAPAPMPAPRPLVFHPLLLAVLQTGVVAAAYWRFPVKK
jgi:hypothetical protein